MKKNEEITIQDLLGLFLPKMWLIVIIAVVCAAGVGIYTRLAKPLTYTASTKLCLYSQDDRTTDQANINAATQNTPLYMMAVTENIFLSDVRLCRHRITRRSRLHIFKRLSRSRRTSRPVPLPFPLRTPTKSAPLPLPIPSAPFPTMSSLRFSGKRRARSFLSASRNCRNMRTAAAPCVMLWSEESPVSFSRFSAFGSFPYWIPPFAIRRRSKTILTFP